MRLLLCLDTILERLQTKLWERVERRGPDECWEWQGKTPDHGYGMVQLNIPAHRLAYIFEHGNIPEGMHLDHTCVNRRCCNPAHLEAVTQSENNRRVSERRTVCKNGRHVISDETSEFVSRGDGRITRMCKPCRQERDGTSSRGWLASGSYFA